MDWDPTKHPRKPKGSPQGGEFTISGAIRRAAEADTRSAPALIGYDIEGDAQGVLPGKLRNLDRSVRKGVYTLDDVARVWSQTRQAIREQYGDKITLYRANAPKSQHNPETLTLYMGDRSTASKFAVGGRRLSRREVLLSDVVAVFAPGNGYQEVIVRKTAFNRSPPRLKTK